MSTTYTSSKSRVYVSSGFEATSGIYATLDTSFYPQPCSLLKKEKQTSDDVVTGQRGPFTKTQESQYADGMLACPLHTEFAGWGMKMAFGSAPNTSALVSPSSTVYEHVWNTFVNPPGTFTLMKQMAALATYTEEFAGVGVKTVAFKSGKGKINMELALEGLGVYQKGASAPSPDVLPATSAYFVGMNSDVLIDGVSLGKGVLMVDWSVNLDVGCGLIDAGGSTDGTMTRFDVTGDPKITADLTLIQISRSQLDDFIAGTYHSYEFVCTGATIDSGNSIKSLVGLKLAKARIVDSWPSEISKHGLFDVKLKLEHVLDASNYSAVFRIRSLATTY